MDNTTVYLLALETDKMQLVMTQFGKEGNQRGLKVTEGLFWFLHFTHPITNSILSFMKI